MFDLKKHTIYMHLAGSRAYGTFNENSDWDYRGIAIPPEIYFYSPFKSFEQKEGVEGYGKDSVVYDIRKHVKLCTDNNPNIMESLYIQKEHQIVTTKYSDLLIANRDLFLSKRALPKFGGYAAQQMKRLKDHRDMMLKHGEVAPARPTRAEFGLSDKRKWPKAVVLNLVGADLSSASDDLRDELIREMRFYQAVSAYDRVIEWQISRNKNRYELEVQHGYDTKHAMHLVRLLRMAKEILVEGTLHVLRPDREELVSIRNGAWSYDKLLGWAKETELELNELGKASKLQEKPQEEKIEELTNELVHDFLAQEGK